jgi:hypothetical protein
VSEPTEEELRAALEEQLKRITVQDVLLQTVVTLINLSGRKLGLAGAEEEKDLDQARLAIDSARALLPFLPEEQAAAVKDALSQVQMAFARQTQTGGEPPPTGPEEPPKQPPGESDVRSKIWTPPGT